MFAFGALHGASLGWEVVTNLHTLRMIEKAGYIEIPAEYGQRGRSAIGPVRHRYVTEGPNSPEHVGAMFEHKGRSFRLNWADGCFKPFLYEYKRG
jgi:hypothetical protein